MGPVRSLWSSVFDGRRCWAVERSRRRRQRPVQCCRGGPELRRHRAEGGSRRHTRLDRENTKNRPGLRPSALAISHILSLPDSAIVRDMSAREPQRTVRKQLRMRSQSVVIAKSDRGLVNRGPRGASRGGFDVSGVNFEGLAAPRPGGRGGAVGNTESVEAGSRRAADRFCAPSLSVGERETETGLQGR